MTATDFGAIERDLTAAFARKLENRRRTNSRVRTALLAIAVTGAFCTAAIASGVAGDLQLDPTKWSLLDGGDVDGGRGTYVHAKNLESGSNATFMVEHDGGLAPYEAFLLHEKTLAAAQATSPVPVRIESGKLCSAAALTRAEQVALATLNAGLRPARMPTRQSGRSTTRRKWPSQARLVEAWSTRASRRVLSMRVCSRGRSSCRAHGEP